MGCTYLTKSSDISYADHKNATIQLHESTLFNSTAYISVNNPIEIPTDQGWEFHGFIDKNINGENYPIFPRDFIWIFDAIPEGLDCLKINESAETPPYPNLCWPSNYTNPGFIFTTTSTAYYSVDQNVYDCEKWEEPSPYESGWGDNYFCKPKTTPYTMAFHRIEQTLIDSAWDESECMNLLWPGQPHEVWWKDNYFCMRNEFHRVYKKTFTNVRQFEIPSQTAWNGGVFICQDHQNVKNHKTDNKICRSEELKCSSLLEITGPVENVGHPQILGEISKGGYYFRLEFSVILQNLENQNLITKIGNYQLKKYANGHYPLFADQYMYESTIYYSKKNAKFDFILRTFFDGIRESEQSFTFDETKSISQIIETNRLYRITLLREFESVENESWMTLEVDGTVVRQGKVTWKVPDTPEEPVYNFNQDRGSILLAEAAVHNADITFPTYDHYPLHSIVSNIVYTDLGRESCPRATFQCSCENGVPSSHNCIENNWERCYDCNQGFTLFTAVSDDKSYCKPLSPCEEFFYASNFQRSKEYQIVSFPEAFTISFELSITEFPRFLDSTNPLVEISGGLNFQIDLAMDDFGLSQYLTKQFSLTVNNFTSIGESGGLISVGTIHKIMIARKDSLEACILEVSIDHEMVLSRFCEELNVGDGISTMVVNIYDSVELNHLRINSLPSDITETCQYSDLCFCDNGTPLESPTCVKSEQNCDSCNNGFDLFHDFTTGQKSCVESAEIHLKTPQTIHSTITYDSESRYYENSQRLFGPQRLARFSEISQFYDLSFNIEFLEMPNWGMSKILIYMSDQELENEDYTVDEFDGKKQEQTKPSESFPSMVVRLGHGNKLKIEDVDKNFLGSYDEMKTNEVYHIRTWKHQNGDICESGLEINGEAQIDLRNSSKLKIDCKIFDQDFTNQTLYLGGMYPNSGVYARIYNFHLTTGENTFSTKSCSCKNGVIDHKNCPNNDLEYCEYCESGYILVSDYLTGTKRCILDASCSKLVEIVDPITANNVHSNNVAELSRYFTKLDLEFDFVFKTVSEGTEHQIMAIGGQGDSYQIRGPILHFDANQRISFDFYREQDNYGKLSFIVAKDKNFMPRIEPQRKYNFRMKVHEKDAQCKAWSA